VEWRSAPQTMERPEEIGGAGWAGGADRTGVERTSGKPSRRLSENGPP